MIFERYYELLQLEHFTLYRGFFMDGAEYEDLTEEDWMRLKHRITIGRFLQYGWHCQMTDTWRVQLSEEEREILATWDWEWAIAHAGSDYGAWRQYLTSAELAYVDGLTDDVVVEGQGGEGAS